MKHFVFILLFFISFLNYSQDSLIISSHPYINSEIQKCRHSEDYGVYLDGLIKHYQNGLTFPDENHLKFYKKLIIYHIDAGWVMLLRGEFEKSVEYINNAEKYTDSVALKYEKDKDAMDIMGAFHNIQKEVCYQIYHKDTAIFRKWDCTRLFPELNEDTLVVVEDTVVKILPDVKTPNKRVENRFGKFYWNDSLRLDNRFVSNKESIKYFVSIKSQILQSLRYIPIPDVYREMGVIQNDSDTLVLKITIGTESNKLVRECEVVYSTCHQLISDHFLNQFSNYDLKRTNKNVSYYIPIIIQIESPTNYNKMDKVTVNNHHFLIECEPLRPIQVD